MAMSMFPPCFGVKLIRVYDTMPQLVSVFFSLLLGYSSQLKIMMGVLIA